MEHMRMIIEIQARIDSCLVGEDGEDGLLLSSDLAGDTGREPDPWLVKQAIRLLRIRHRVLRAWEFDGDNLENINDGDEHAGGETTVGFPPGRSGIGGGDGRSGSRKPSGGGGAGGGGDEARRRRRRSRMRTRDGRAFGFDNDEFFEYSMYDDTPAAGPGARGDGVPGDGGGRGESKSGRDGGEFEARLEKQRPPKTNQDAADAAGAGVVAALMEGRRRLIVEVDDSQLRYNSPDFCHEAMAEFVELLVLPLTTALENLKARQNRCKIVIQGAHHASQVKEAMVLDAPASLQVVSLSDAKVAKKDRVVALVAPENWTGKKGRHLKRVLAEAHDAAIILINPIDADKFLQARPADYNTFELVYHLSPMRVNYLHSLPPPQHPSLDLDSEADRGTGAGRGQPTGEALLLERLGESVWAEEEALAAEALAAAASAAAAAAASSVSGPVDVVDGSSGAGDKADSTGVAGATGAESSSENASVFDETSAVGAAAAAEIGVRAAERALARAALKMGASAAAGGGSGGGGGSARDQQLDWGDLDIGYRDRSEWDEMEDERLSDEAAAAALAAWSEEEEGEGSLREKELRWGEGEVGEWDGEADEAAEMAALAVTLRQYPDAWEAFVDLHDGVGFRLCGTWDREPPPSAVKTVVMDHILRIIMD
ncbi:unnamed protein product [Ectocarpus sp. CCAP 1310/34]|nr:unnamed protein product [Ectocarpus sp. CCAP 1310/34]